MATQFFYSSGTGWHYPTIALSSGTVYSIATTQSSYYANATVEYYCSTSTAQLSGSNLPSGWSSTNMGWRYHIKAVGTGSEMPANPISDSNYAVWMGNSNTQTAFDSVAGGSTQASKVVFMIDIPTTTGACGVMNTGNLSSGIYVHYLSITFQNQSVGHSRYYDNGVVTPGNKRNQLNIHEIRNNSIRISKRSCPSPTTCNWCGNGDDRYGCGIGQQCAQDNCGNTAAGAGAVKVTKGIPGNGGGGAWDEYDAKRTSSDWYLFWIYYNQMAYMSPTSVGGYGVLPAVSMTVF